MQKLNMFQKFDLQSFLENKSLEVASFKEHKKYEDGKPVGIDGVAITVAVVRDNTDYGTPGISNLYQTFNIRINGATLEEVSTRFSPGDSVMLIRYDKASIYGEYRNQLSVQCNDINDLEKI